MGADIVWGISFQEVNGKWGGWIDEEWPTRAEAVKAKADLEAGESTRSMTLGESYAFCGPVKYRVVAMSPAHPRRRGFGRNWYGSED